MSARAPRMLWAPLLALALFAAPASAQIVRGFTPRFTANDRGDIVIVGNTLMTCGGGGGCVAGQAGLGGGVNNDAYVMQFVDVDGVDSTFCSSSASLALPPGAVVLWAGLYWGGSSSDPARDRVVFSTPAAAGILLGATRLDASGSDYQGFADVTALVAAGGSGTYLAANVRSTAARDQYAGWSLVVAYRLESLPLHNLVVFDGYARLIPSVSVSIPVSGFLTPRNGAVNTRLGVVAYEGDLGLPGDRFLLDGVPLRDAASPSDNFFNSSISALGATVTAKSPHYVNQLGFDIDRLALVNALPNNATGATIGLETSADRFFPGVVTFTTELYAPDLSGSGFRKTVADLNGGPAQPGDVLEYTIAVTNLGDDDAVQTVLADPLPANATYVPGSIAVLSGANAGAKTDAAGDDQAEYDALLRRVVVRLGAGADAASGGTLASSTSTLLRFRVTVGMPAPSGSTVANQAGLDFSGGQTGIAYASQSDGDSMLVGSQPTVITVTAPVISGRVFEDADYGGGAGRSLAASSGAVRPGARVELYAGTGAWLAADTTDAIGAYAFDGWGRGGYVVRVVNATVTSSRPGAVAGLLPVQTFRTDASGGTAVAVTDRVGGEIPASADAAANTTAQTLGALTTAGVTAQSVAPVTLAAAGVGGLDFGFNFDLVVNANDAGQGSLRQFILNANALGNAGLAQAGQPPGVETSLFMVSDGAAHPGLRAGLPNLLTGGVVVVTAASALPALTDASTRLDGTTQTAHVGDTQAGTIGAGGAVGVDLLALPAVARPEVELRDGAAIALGLDLQGSGTAVVGMAVTGFGNLPGNDAHANLRVGAAAAGVLVERCVLGSSAAAFADPGPGARSGGDNLRVVGGDAGVVRNSLVGFAAGNGIALTAGSNAWQVLECEVRGNAVGQGARDGVAIEASAGATLRGSLVAAHEGPGIDARAGGGTVVVENCTVAGNGTGAGAGVETPGIRLGGAGNRVDRCVVTANSGAGVLLVPGAATTTLTRNSIHGNGAGPGGQLGIDLLAAGQDEATGTAPFVTPNDAGDTDTGANGLLNFPVLETAVLANGSFTLTGWSRPGAAIELFVAAADASGFGEGLAWVATFTEGSGADLDPGSSAYAGPVNGVDQGSDFTNRFRFTVAAPAGVVPGASLTATATLAAATSEFSGLVAIASGVAVAGALYADADHDLQRDAGEAGTGLALFAKLVPAAAPATAQAVVAVDPASGLYAFTFVPAGTYSIVMDDNALPADLTPTPPAGWIVTEAAPGVRTGITVAATDVSGQDVGLFHGSRVEGVVFRDDGGGAGTANDGVPQAGEAGVPSVRVRLASAACAGGACDSTLTDAAGAWVLWLPAAAAGPVEVRETNAAGWISTGAAAGTTGGLYARPADALAFTAVAGTAYAGVAFGNVPGNALVPAGARSGAPGGVVFHPHTFTAGSAGTVTFTLARSPSPPIPGWSAELYRDLDCDGALDAGEPVMAAPLAVTAGQTVCLVLRHVIPAGVPGGAQESVTLAAGYDYLNAAPALASVVQVGDLTTAVAGGGLGIVKSVDVLTARPGEYIRYTITYQNLGAEPLTSIAIQDATPAFTVFDSAACGGLGAGLTGCAVTGAPASGAAGAVSWTLSGALAPGASGTVSFRVRVQ